METVCQFNKFGFCKFRNNCFRKPEDKIHENGDGDVQKL